MTGFGFDAAGHAIGGGDRWDARQAVTANYSRTGFEAAAVTAIAARMAMRPRQLTARVAELRFAHPYAVVAASATKPSSPWNGLPLFSAWITEPRDAS